jgi:acyl-CoA reductase-like NAD-dependent aldehyde dehydrogenase
MSLMQIEKQREKQRETILASAKLDGAFYNIIGGKRLAATRHLSVINPATGKALATVPDIVAATLDDAVEAARKAFPGWRALPLARRKQALSGVLIEIARHAEELIVLLTAEQGRPLSQARWEIDLLTNLYGPAFLKMDLPQIEQHVAGIGHVFKRHTPRGVVGAITPWNVPVLLSFNKAFSAMLAGNTVILKPSPFTPLTVLRIADYIRELLPPGVLNTVTGGDELGPWMTSHSGIDHITFTGSTATGKRVLASASATLKHVGLELGGNDPGIVLADADPRAIAQDLFNSMFLLSGQGCICLKRLYIDEEIYPAVTEALVTIARSAKVGNGLDPDTALGPIQNQLQYQRLQSFWEEIKKSGAKILYRGDVPANETGFFFPVTLLDNPPEDASFVVQEIFGPIRSVFKYKTVDEAIRRANNTSYGLGASVWGKRSDELQRIAGQLEAGTVWINQHLVRNPFVPATAYKNSGIGVELGEEGLKEFCNVQVIAAKH